MQDLTPLFYYAVAAGNGVNSAERVVIVGDECADTGEADGGQRAAGAVAVIHGPVVRLDELSALAREVVEFVGSSLAFWCARKAWLFGILVTGCD